MEMTNMGSPFYKPVSNTVLEIMIGYIKEPTSIPPLKMKSTAPVSQKLSRMAISLAVFAAKRTDPCTLSAA